MQRALEIATQTGATLQALGARCPTTTDAINVGQRIVAYGTLSGSTLALTAPGAGFVRLLATGISGAVTAPTIIAERKKIAKHVD